MLRMIFLASCLVLTSAANASLISYNGYSRDISSNVVNGGALEWLKWDQTTGESINSAIEKYSSSGWRLASNEDMVELFNAFKFKSTNWIARETISQGVTVPWAIGEQSPFYSFIELFGVTLFDVTCKDVKADCFDPAEPLSISLALYGSDLNKNGNYHRAFVRDDDYFYPQAGEPGFTEHSAYLHLDSFKSNRSNDYTGVALVRTATITTPAVSTPSSFYLFAIGFAAFGVFRRLLSAK